MSEAEANGGGEGRPAAAEQEPFAALAALIAQVRADRDGNPALARDLDLLMALLARGAGQDEIVPQTVLGVPTTKAERPSWLARVARRAAFGGSDPAAEALLSLQRTIGPAPTRCAACGQKIGG